MATTVKMYLGYNVLNVVTKSVFNCVNSKKHRPSSLKALSLKCSICICFINNSFGGQILCNKLKFKYTRLGCDLEIQFKCHLMITAFSELSSAPLKTYL